MVGRYVGATRNTGNRDTFLTTNLKAQHKSPRRIGIVSKLNQAQVNNKG
jgi:hypothetical protein